jgi:hypothetical protein
MHFLERMTAGLLRSGFMKRMPFPACIVAAAAVSLAADRPAGLGTPTNADEAKVAAALKAIGVQVTLDSKSPAKPVMYLYVEDTEFKRR